MPLIAQTLTHASPLFAQVVPDLPAAPLPERLALEEPWLSILAFVTLGAIGAWLLARTNRRRYAFTALAIGIALAALNLACSILVTTTREHVAELSRRAISCIIEGRAADLELMLRSDLVVHPFGITRDRVLSEVETSMRGKYSVKDYRELSLRTTIDSPSAARSQVHLRVTPQNELGFPASSWWRLTWQHDQTRNLWLISRIECLQFDGVSQVDRIRP